MGHGSIGIKPLECVNPRITKWRVRWNIRPETGTDEKGNPKTGVTFEEKEFTRKPTLEEIKEVVHEWMNRQIDCRILAGFSWQDMPVWLSTENQFNYKAAFDIALQTGGQNLPVKFKLSDGNYHLFSTVGELMEFYTSAMGYIQQILNAGWEEKDSVDFSVYEQLLNND
jgi:hypothetical protein